MSKRWFVPAVLVTAALSLVVSLGVSSAQPTGGAAAGTLRVGASQGIPQLNPVIRTFAWEEVLFPLLWDGLTKWTPTGATAPDHRDVVDRLEGQQDVDVQAPERRQVLQRRRADRDRRGQHVQLLPRPEDGVAGEEQNRHGQHGHRRESHHRAVQAQDRECPLPDGDHQRQDREDGRSGELQQESDHDGAVQGLVVRARLDA